jgi:hypothetical protein
MPSFVGFQDIKIKIIEYAFNNKMTITGNEGLGTLS